MAKDFLLQSGGVIASAFTISTTGTKYYSAPVSLEPFGSNGANSLLFGRFMLAPGVTYAAAPGATTASAFQFGFDVSKDGSTWTAMHQSPTDAQAYRTHDVYTLVYPTNASSVCNLNYATSSTTAGVSASANITSAPVVSIGDVVTFGTTANGFTAATPYYVISSTPTAATQPSATSTCTIQVSLTPGGPAVVGTGTGTPTVTRYYPASLNIAVGDALVVTGATVAGANPASLTAGTTLYVNSITASSYAGLTVTLATTFGGAAFAPTTAFSSGTFVTRALAPLSEYFFPVPTINGFIDAYGIAQDVYKYVRGWVTCNFPSGVNPTVPSARFDLVPSRDGAYS